jgi:hypothetical protein
MRNRSIGLGGRLVLLLGVAGCVSTAYRNPPGPPARSQLMGTDPTMHISLREDRHEIEVVVGPLQVPPTRSGIMDHAHSHDEETPLAVFAWPVEQGLAGVHLAAYRAGGDPLPRDVFHHVIGVNLDRRQLVYPVAERLFGFGSETPDIKLPDFLEIPVVKGDSIGIYGVWKNETGETLRDVFMQVVLPYAPPGKEREQVLPIYMDTNNVIGGTNTFDLPPGRHLRSHEFELPVSGALLAAGGHLHDFGTELRVEEVDSGEVVVKLEPEVDREGRVVGVEQAVFRRLFGLLDARVPLREGVRYRVVGEYENPTGNTISEGGMAHVVGLFVPDDLSRLPDVDRSSREYLLDLSGLPERIGGHSHFMP